jgi:hypothetical protein
VDTGRRGEPRGIVNTPGLAKTGAQAYSRTMVLMDKIKKWLGMGKKKA